MAKSVAKPSQKRGAKRQNRMKSILFFAELDVGDAWEVDSDDDLGYYGEDDLKDLPANDYVTVKVDQRKSSTGSQVLLVNQYDLISQLVG